MSRPSTSLRRSYSTKDTLAGHSPRTGTLFRACGRHDGDCYRRASLSRSDSISQDEEAERVPGYEQAPDFFVPEEFNPALVIEAKITGDDGTARDKVARIERLTRMRNDRRRKGQPDFEVIACIDGRGFGVRREDMRTLITMTEGKVFTLATLDQMVAYTQLREFLPTA